MSEVTGWVRKRLSSTELPGVNNFLFIKDCWVCLKELPESCSLSAPRVLTTTGKNLVIYAMVFVAPAVNVLARSS